MIPQERRIPMLNHLLDFLSTGWGYALILLLFTLFRLPSHQRKYYSDSKGGHHRDSRKAR